MIGFILFVLLSLMSFKTPLKSVVAEVEVADGSLNKIDIEALSKNVSSTQQINSLSQCQISRSQEYFLIQQSNQDNI